MGCWEVVAVGAVALDCETEVAQAAYRGAVAAGGKE